MRAALEKVVAILGSFGLCVVLLGLLLVLTFFGTLEQQHASIYDVQKKYFESLVLTNVRLGAGDPTPVLLPGAYLVLSLLAVNLIVGGLVRIRKRVATLGVIVAHVGVLILLAAGLVEFRFSTKGTLALAEHDLGRSWRKTSDEFEAYYEWDLIVAEHRPDGGVLERVIPYERLEDLDPGESARFADPALPFEVRVSDWCRNARVLPSADPTLDGVELRRIPPHPEKAERNTPGAVVALEPRQAGAGSVRAVVHAGQLFPWRVTLSGPHGATTYDVDLRRRRWEVPFALELEQFVARYHPGTDRPKEFSSRVIKHEDGTTEPVFITMNQPLRHRGYTFFQSSFSRPEDLGGVVTPWVSVFSVVSNPADAWPEVACWVIAVGLLLHLGRKLWLYAKAEAAKRSAA